jgi:hypothetical protein
MKPASLLVAVSADAAICAAVAVPDFKHDVPTYIPDLQQKATQTNPGIILSPVPSMPSLW